jgi:hypothetical protein
MPSPASLGAPYLPVCGASPPESGTSLPRDVRSLPRRLGLPHGIEPPPAPGSPPGPRTPSSRTVPVQSESPRLSPGPSTRPPRSWRPRPRSCSSRRASRTAASLGGARHGRRSHRRPRRGERTAFSPARSTSGSFPSLAPRTTPPRLLSHGARSGLSPAPVLPLRGPPDLAARNPTEKLATLRRLASSIEQKLLEGSVLNVHGALPRHSQHLPPFIPHPSKWRNLAHSENSRALPPRSPPRSPNPLL